MTNLALHEALTNARMTEVDLAAWCQVDPKTVGRWLANERRMPHRRYRLKACEKLGVGEDVLWPEAIRHQIKTGPDREIIAVYPFRSQVPNALWKHLISDAKSDIIFAGYTNYFLWLEQPNLGAVLRRKVQKGCRVRFILGDPDSEVTARREDVEGVPLKVGTRIHITLDELRKTAGSGIEVRFCDELLAAQHMSTSVFKFDNDMLESKHLADKVGHESPTLHLRRVQTDGIFDRLAFHASELWRRGREVTF